MTAARLGQLVQINVFKTKTGMMDEFIQMQLKRLPQLGSVQGLLASRLYRANDDRDAILVSTWENEKAQSLFRESPAFHEQRAVLQPFLDSANPALYTLVHLRETPDPCGS